MMTTDIAAYIKSDRWLRNAIVMSWICAGLALVSLLSGCAIPRSPATGADHAYIKYWPPPENSNGPRLAVKDLIDMKGVVTTAGSEYLAKNSPPAARDAACLAIARERNVRIVGRTNVTEFAVTVSGINRYFGTPRNRVAGRRRLIPGGSSSGSAVAVENGTADIAFGTDTAGSIRVPAACCGVVGLKTTFGLVPLDGVYPIAPEYLDTVGPLGKDVSHVAQGMDLLQRGFAAKYQAATVAKPSGRNIRVARLYLDGTDPEIERAVDRAIAAAGFQVVVLGNDFKKKWEQADKDAKTVALAEAWINDHGFQNLKGISLTTKAVFALGRIEFGTNYRAALRRRTEWQQEVRDVLADVNFIVVPTMRKLPPRVPFFGGSPAFEAAVVAMQNTAAVNLAGNPALALPVPVNSKVVKVTSLQLIGRRLSEAELLNAGRLIETKLPLKSGPDRSTTAAL